MAKIFAAAAGELFDRNHSKTMKLPFEKGWDHWVVNKRKFNTYQEAAKCARTSPRRTH